MPLNFITRCAVICLAMLACGEASIQTVCANDGNEFFERQVRPLLVGKCLECHGANEPEGGRDHNHWGFTVWLAGGGVKGRVVHGATDDFGNRALHDPVHVHDRHATILHLLGFDHTKLAYRHTGRDYRLTDVHGQVVRDILA